MRDELIPFQKQAVSNILREIHSAVTYYKADGRPQVIAFRAPTGSGKTIVMATVIEEIFCGNETYAEEPEAIFVWLSDAPQLNEQSKLKIIRKADKVQPAQCITITEDSFDQETLDEGYIYFLNTQKLSKSSRLVNAGDSRTYTIWQTLQNTVEQKGNHLYFIIDEAHRGMQDREAAKATTIMQKFLKGSESDGLSPIPIVIGMSATDERFRRLVGNISSMRHDVDVRPDEVRASGLLKDRIIIHYPDQDRMNDMVVLQAAADDWKNKCDHWNYYCITQKCQQVRPILVIQVENRDSESSSATEIGECVARIEQRTGEHFSEHEVVHTFGQTGIIEVAGLKIHHVDAADIADDRTIRVVFFKENLAVGWDCPRAETMMSFRSAEDSTYIAQLLGRMIRTPLQRHIDVDDTLNDVRLFLPHYNKDNVEKVTKALQEQEGSEIPADTEGEAIGSEGSHPWGYHPRRGQKPVPNQVSMNDVSGSADGPAPQHSESNEGWKSNSAGGEPEPEKAHNSSAGDSCDNQGPTPQQPEESQTDAPLEGIEQQGAAQLDAAQSRAAQPEQPEASNQEDESSSLYFDYIDRDSIAAFINNLALKRYEISPFRTVGYLESLVALATLIKNTGLDINALLNIQQDGIQMIEDYIQSLKDEGVYAALAENVKKLNLSWQVFDAFGAAIDSDKDNIFYTSSDEDIDRKFRQADKILGGFGFGAAYGAKHFDPDDTVSYMVHVILFAADKDCQEKLHLYAKDKFDKLSDSFRLQFAHCKESVRQQYDKIISSGNKVGTLSFLLPMTIKPQRDPNGEKYYDHFFVDEREGYGYAQIALDSWEKAVLDEERKRDDFVCWIRNPSREKWALCLKREEGKEVKRFYPDFLIIRNVPDIGYVIDILEPHRYDLTDNLSKAKALAEYAHDHATKPLGRVQLIREGKDNITGAKRMKRLDLAKSAVQAKVMNLQTTTELDQLFLDDKYVD